MTAFAPASRDGGTMYERIMGASFSRLAPEVQQFHRLVGKHTLHGRVEVHAPKSLLTKLLALLLGTPHSASEGAIKFELDAQPLAETWTRHFPMKTMTSRLQLIDGQIVEKRGAARLLFELSEKQGQLRMHLRRLHFLGFPCPDRLMPRVVAEETGRDGCLHFLVRAEISGVGLVASYQGYLAISESGNR